MVSSGMLCRVALVRTDVSEELSASFIRVTRIGELGTTLAVTSNWRTLRKNTKWEGTPFSNLPEDTILHIHRRENLKSYISLLFYGPWALLGLGRSFQFHNPIHSLLGSVDGESAGCQGATYTQKNHIPTSLPRARFEHTTPINKQAKTTDDLDRVASPIVC
jgi:hypothetical protein